LVLEFSRWPEVAVVGTPWDADTYDRTSEPQQSWASEVLARLATAAAIDASVVRR
jgi:hypothetical protein